MNDSEFADTRMQYWKAQIDAWQASGQSQRAFYQASQLNYPRIGYWLRKFRRQGVPRFRSGNPVSYLLWPHRRVAI
jgi:hypothetical protein